MNEPDLERREKPCPARVVVNRRVVEAGDMTVVLATEDVSEPTDWRFEEAHHTLVLHLAGHLRRMESVFSRGPSSSALPSIGDVWTIPAGCAYAALAQGDQVRFAEFRVPVDLLGGGHLAPRVGHRDPFLHQAGVRAAALAERTDDLGRMALVTLLEAVRCHIADHYLAGSRVPAQPIPPLQCFSERTKRRLVDHIAASLNGPVEVDGLAAVAELSGARFVQGFKASFGTTPWQYVLRARLAEARRLLAVEKVSITEISAMTGFSSPSHLATCFRKHFGLSPVAYRRQAPVSSAALSNDENPRPVL